MPPEGCPDRRRTTAWVLVVAASLSGAVLLLGDRFDVAPSDALTRPAPFPAPARMAACVADENMRLIDPDRARCEPGEIELISRG